MMKSVIILLTTLTFIGCGQKTNNPSQAEEYTPVDMSAVTGPKVTTVQRSRQSWQTDSQLISILGVGDAGWARNGFAVAHFDGFNPNLKNFDPRQIILKSDIKFINWESSLGEDCVYSKRERLGQGSYAFISHPQVLKNAIRLQGFNLVNLTNNHTRDCYQYKLSQDEDIFASERYAFGLIKQWEKGRNHFGIVGLSDRGNLSPKIIHLNKGGSKIKVAFNGIYAHYHHSPSYCRNLANCYEDHDRIMQEIMRSDADLKILSIHHQGQKGFNRSEAMARKFITVYGGDIVLAHGAHKYGPVRMLRKPNGKLGVHFSDFGNFLHPGVSGHGRNIIGKVEYDPKLKLFVAVKIMTIGTQQVSLNSSKNGLFASPVSAQNIQTNFQLQSGRSLKNGMNEAMHWAYAWFK